MRRKAAGKLKPKLRFPEFRGAPGWKEKELVGLIFTITPPQKILTSQYLDIGSYPIVDQSQGFIAGWTDDDSAVIKSGFPLIVFGDHTCVLKIINQPFAQGADGIKIFRANSNVSTSYLYQFLQFKPVKMEEYKRHFSILKSRNIFYPDEKSGEQQKIADCLSSIDELIETQTKKLDNLKVHKKGLMQQLFPLEGETLPKLRFPEFQTARPWDEKRLSDICSINPSSERLPESFFYIDLESVIDGKLASKTKIYREYAPSRAQRLLKNGDVIYQTVRPYQKNNFFCDFDVENEFVASTGYAQLRAYGCCIFLYQIIHTDAFVNKVITKCSGSNYPAINASDLAEINVAIPHLSEQQKIADCLSFIDELIGAQTQKLEQLKAQKKGLMQQLFHFSEEK